MVSFPKTNQDLIDGVRRRQAAHVDGELTVKVLRPN